MECLVAKLVQMCSFWKAAFGGKGKLKGTQPFQLHIMKTQISEPESKEPTCGKMIKSHCGKQPTVGTHPCRTMERATTTVALVAHKTHIANPRSNNQENKHPLVEK